MNRAIGPFDTKLDPMTQNLRCCVMENWHRAALEITDGADMARMPEMLNTVRRSVARTRRAPEHLMWHANSVSAQE